MEDTKSDKFIMGMGSAFYYVIDWLHVPLLFVLVQSLSGKSAETNPFTGYAGFIAAIELTLSFISIFTSPIPILTAQKIADPIVIPLFSVLNLAPLVQGFLYIYLLNYFGEAFSCMLIFMMIFGFIRVSVMLAFCAGSILEEYDKQHPPAPKATQKAKPVVKNTASTATTSSSSSNTKNTSQKGSTNSNPSVTTQQQPRAQVSTTTSASTTATKSPKAQDAFVFTHNSPKAYKGTSPSQATGTNSPAKDSTKEQQTSASSLNTDVSADKAKATSSATNQTESSVPKDKDQPQSKLSPSETYPESVDTPSEKKDEAPSKASPVTVDELPEGRDTLVELQMPRTK